jgi:hypothetical protein
MDGKQQHTYQYDSNKHRLFTLPRRITTNNNKDIVVLDMTSLDTGRVVVVGREVNPKMKFMEINHLQIKLEDHQKRGILAQFFFKSVELFKSYDHFKEPKNDKFLVL